MPIVAFSGKPAANRWYGQPVVDCYQMSDFYDFNKSKASDLVKKVDNLW